MQPLLPKKVKEPKSKGHFAMLSQAVDEKDQIPAFLAKDPSFKNVPIEVRAELELGKYFFPFWDDGRSWYFSFDIY